MRDETGRVAAIRSYLLGNLPESEAEEIEKWYFAGGQGPLRVDEIWAVFGEIVEEYQSGALSEIESRRFEQRLRSSPGLREMFENEKALFDSVARIAAGTSRQAEADDSAPDEDMDEDMKAGWSERPRTPFFKPWRLAVAGVIALTAIITWFASRTRQSENPVSTAQFQTGFKQPAITDQKSPAGAAQPLFNPQRSPQPGHETNNKPAEEKKTSTATALDQRNPGSRNSPGITATFLLSAARTREGQSGPILEISAQTNIVQLELELSNHDCALFSAELRTEPNVILQRWDRLRARRDHSIPRVVLQAQAGSLENASYAVKLYCVSRHNNSLFAEEYRFKLEKK